ncbi:BQ2448_1910 [Microbotryum intermedium]|uniref:BQ2448_1910 protein n=1 Tax=Microbotryum intermedium TaxID=269621 RepID=A0A238FHK3_9BASI|nr:BQ2448_1910 [Microbotryum intermedium]
MLVDYASDESDHEQQPPVAAPSKSLPSVPVQNNDDDDEQATAFDPSDAFGLAQLDTQAEGESTTRPNPVANINADTAPLVFVTVSHSVWWQPRTPPRAKRTAPVGFGCTVIEHSHPAYILHKVDITDPCRCCTMLCLSLALFLSCTLWRQDPSFSSSTSLITRPSDNVIFYNPTYADMTLPVQGPANPWDDRRLEKMNSVTGHVEQQAYSDLTFRTQQRTFHVHGYAANPSILRDEANANGTQAIVGDARKAAQNDNATVHDLKISRADARATKRKRKGKGQLGVLDDSDPEPEADQVEEETEQVVQDDGTVIEAPKVKSPKMQKVQKEYLGPWAGWEGENIGVVNPSEAEYEEQEERGGAPLNKKQRKEVIKDSGKEVGFGQEKSVFHGKETHDYLGRTYMHIPTDVDVNLTGESGTQECFAPKKVIHTWSGHTKGVSRIKLFPKSGHLILSGSMDTRVKLWDVYREGKCLRTFMGHSKAVHDVTFDNDGAQFLSCAFDRQMKLWDTETGACKQAFSNGKIPYTIKFNPNNNNVFLAGMHDKKIIQVSHAASILVDRCDADYESYVSFSQYDMRSGEIVQEYDQHLGPVNTITFVDENRRFITSSDDKMMRVWDIDIPVPIKLIAEPSMHSMPAVSKHPSGKWLAMQSLDNQVLIFGSDNFKQNRKKRFAGHTIAGYACEPQFSPDGRYLSSGDGHGSLVIWDFKTCRIAHRQKVHSQVLLSHAWLPHETSKVITSSWDGSIKCLD